MHAGFAYMPSAKRRRKRTESRNTSGAFLLLLALNVDTTEAAVTGVAARKAPVLLQGSKCSYRESTLVSISSSPRQPLQVAAESRRALTVRYDLGHRA